MTKTLKDSHEFYKKEGGKVDSKKYREVCLMMNELVSDWILEGNSFNMGSYMGKVQVLRYERTFQIGHNGKPLLPVNWGETNKLKKQGINKIVYHTDKYYYGWNWSRGICKIPGKMAYKFEATRSNGTTSKRGNKNKLVSLLRSDDLAYLRFKLIEK